MKLGSSAVLVVTLIILLFEPHEIRGLTDCNYPTYMGCELACQECHLPCEVRGRLQMTSH